MFYTIPSSYTSLYFLAEKSEVLRSTNSWYTSAYGIMNLPKLCLRTIRNLAGSPLQTCRCMYCIQVKESEVSSQGYEVIVLVQLMQNKSLLKEKHK